MLFCAWFIWQYFCHSMQIWILFIILINWFQIFKLLLKFFIFFSRLFVNVCSSPINMFKYFFCLLFIIRYVGSPYQTSLSEAGQEKYLYCMNSKTGLDDDNSNDNGLLSSSNYFWREESRWPLDVGRKYFRVSFDIPFITFGIFTFHFIFIKRILFDFKFYFTIITISVFSFI